MTEMTIATTEVQNKLDEMSASKIFTCSVINRCIKWNDVIHKVLVEKVKSSDSIIKLQSILPIILKLTNIKVEEINALRRYNFNEYKKSLLTLIEQFSSFIIWYETFLQKHPPTWLSLNSPGEYLLINEEEILKEISKEENKFNTSSMNPSTIATEEKKENSKIISNEEYIKLINKIKSSEEIKEEYLNRMDIIVNEMNEIRLENNDLKNKVNLNKSSKENKDLHGIINKQSKIIEQQKQEVKSVFIMVEELKKQNEEIKFKINNLSSNESRANKSFNNQPVGTDLGQDFSDSDRANSPRLHIPSSNINSTSSSQLNPTSSFYSNSTSPSTFISQDINSNSSSYINPSPCLNSIYSPDTTTSALLQIVNQNASLVNSVTKLVENNIYTKDDYLFRGSSPKEFEQRDAFQNYQWFLTLERTLKGYPATSLSKKLDLLKRLVSRNTNGWLQYDEESTIYHSWKDVRESFFEKFVISKEKALDLFNHTLIKAGQSPEHYLHELRLFADISGMVSVPNYKIILRDKFLYGLQNASCYQFYYVVRDKFSDVNDVLRELNSAGKLKSTSSNSLKTIKGEDFYLTQNVIGFESEDKHHRKQSQQIQKSVKFDQDKKLTKSLLIYFLIMKIMLILMKKKFIMLEKMKNLSKSKITLY